ncbi:pantetheine-phosphate adenylyltransferase [Dethiobacter alkaliphilus]|uniref:Phosphopantetheine adenylyltransferase n=1 Tax=Dethiobacter alkaliphilus AHT 1 TaxID=555088 RepID=C0GHJ7_DETAL|nr:pantetheine-phosphate adenylyltransferase [Dethiobacter alkaliphilus]EEG77203.1 pantetheine-phosphate adenylyltransferase [Dethiobacter alkaliphilus AHT 1]
MTVAIYPGSFDPVTNGHRDIIERASRVFDKVVVSVLENPRKQPMFTIEERVEMLKMITNSYENVEVDSFQGLLIDYAKQKNSNIVVKGLRAMSDFEFEFQMALINRKLDSRLETMFMMTNNRYSYVSSSIVKEIGSYGGDICELVPNEVYNIIMRRLRQERDA